MPEVTLSKALKLKNRQVQKVNELARRVSTSNSYLVGSQPDFDAKAVYEELTEARAKLWQLKAAINAANVPIHGLIYEMAETRSQVAWLSGLDTQRGMSLTSYMASEPQEYEAQLDAVFVASEVERLQARLDDIQDQLDQHNATTRVEVDL